MRNKTYLKKKILITAGPTYEAIDPVRFIGNHSTGKMGYAIAMEAAIQGAEVTLISGPTQLHINHPLITRIDVVSAQEMFEASMLHFPNCDAAILSAAVADFTPKIVADKKIKEKQSLTIELQPTPDIAQHIGAIKQPHQVVCGFALETHNAIEHAKAKLIKKNFDCIILNSLTDKGAGFGHDTNKISIIDTSGNCTHFELKKKTEVAKDIILTLATLLAQKHSI